MKSSEKCKKRICNLMYRRFAIGWAWGLPEDFGPADALQNAILRYGRVQLCVTASGPTSLAESASFVAQICNLLYRRFAIGWAWGLPEDFGLAGAVQNAILRYGTTKAKPNQRILTREHGKGSVLENGYKLYVFSALTPAAP